MLMDNISTASGGFSFSSLNASYSTCSKFMN